MGAGWGFERRQRMGVVFQGSPLNLRGRWPVFSHGDSLPVSSKNTPQPSGVHKTCACCYGDVWILAGCGEDVMNPWGQGSAGNVTNGADHRTGYLWAGTARPWAAAKCTVTFNKTKRKWVNSWWPGSFLWLWKMQTFLLANSVSHVFFFFLRLNLDLPQNLTACFVSLNNLNIPLLSVWVIVHSFWRLRPKTSTVNHPLMTLPFQLQSGPENLKAKQEELH